MAINAHEENLGQVLWDNNIYLVPPYQRNYSWTKDQISTLWDDLMRIAHDGDTYFLGSMVFVQTDSAMVFHILDGQQRFASMMLLVAAFRDLIRQTIPDSQALSALQQILIKVDVTGRFSHQDVVHVRLNHQDEEFFDSLVKTGSTPTARHNSHKLMAKAYADFSELIKAECQKRSVSAETLWARLRDAATQRLFIIRITVDEFVNAQQVFQALNSAGMELSQADLIKNYVLMEADRTNFDTALKLWLEVTQTVGDASLTTYCRSHWNSNYTFVRTNDLYKTLSNRVKLHPDASKNEIDVMLYLRQLRDESTVYEALRNPDVSYWGSGSAALVQDLSDFRDFNAQMVYVPLLALRYALANDTRKFAQAVHSLLVFYVRHTVVGGRAANEIEEPYSKWAGEIRRGEMNADQLRAELVRLAPGDNEFKDALLALAVARQRTALILLARINDSVDPENSIRHTMTVGGKVHVEHIIPQQPERWAEFLEQENLEHEDVVTRFGNLTLLLGPKNQEASNRPFDEKLPAYRADGHPEPINVMLAGLTRFGAAELKARQEWLADRALQVWKWS